MQKKLIVIVLVLSSFVLSGFALQPIKLINANKPFVELSGSVGTAIGNAQKAKDDLKKKLAEAENKKTVQVEQKEKKTTIVNSQDSTDLYIKIYGEEIRIADSRITIDDLRINLKTGEYKNKHIIVEDNFAEARTVIDILKILEDEAIDYKYSCIKY